MKKTVLFAAITLMLGILYFFGYNNSEVDAVAERDPGHLAWCDRIYHQNVGCPQHGEVEIPAEVLAQQEADHLAWCDSIYHQNVGCPQHGEVEIPAEVLAQQEADHLAWCKSINNRNVGCPKS